MWQSFALEVFLTWFLMLAVLGVSTGAKEKGITAGIAVGAIIALEALFAGPICGASMNPARSLAPAVVSGQVDTRVDLPARPDPRGGAGRADVPVAEPTRATPAPWRTCHDR